MIETKLEDINSNPRLPYIDRYINRNGIKFYLHHSNIFKDDHGERFGIWFIANPKYRESNNMPDITFKFVVTRTFLARNNLYADQGLAHKFIYHFGFYEFKNWLNELNEIKSVSNVLEYNTQKQEDFSTHILNGQIQIPTNIEDDDRLEKIAENCILKEYYSNRGKYKIDPDILKEVCFVPNDIFDFVLNKLSYSKYIDKENSKLTSAGIAYYKNYNSDESPQSQYSQTVFIAQSFSPDMVKFYNDVLEPLVKEFKLNPILVSNEEPEDTIDASILNHIRTCRFMICDLTHSRPSVYFESGYAIGRGVNVIHTCREDHNSDSENFDAAKNKVHFDVRNRKITWWDSTKLDEFREELRNRIKNFLEMQK